MFDWWFYRRSKNEPGLLPRRERQSASAEPLEARRHLAAHLGYYFAPPSVANGTFTATIGYATAPLQIAGTYTIQPNSVPQAIIGATGTPTVDAYSYGRMGRSTAVLRFTDAATGVTYADSLIFDTGSDTTGTFSIVPAAVGAAGGVQSGRFVFSSAVPARGADPIATVLSVAGAKTTVNGNTAGVAAVKITNAGNASAIGYIGADYYLSPDGLLADAIPLGTSGRFLFLRQRASFNTILHFDYPNLPTGAYFLLVQLNPSLQFIDTDRGNDLAAAATPVQVNTRPYDLSVPIVAVHAVGSAGRQSGRVVIENDADAPAVGLVRLDISAVATAGTQTPVPTPVSPQGIPVNLDIAAHHRLVLPVSFTSAGSSFVAAINTSGLSSEPQPFVSLQTTLLSVAPINVQVPDAVPGALNGNRLARTTLSVTDAGNVALFGRVAITLEASTDAAGDSPTILISVEKNLLLGVGAQERFFVNFRVPAALATGDYFILAQAGPSTTTLAVPTFSTRLNVPPGNLSATPAPLLIVRPAVPTLTATVAPLVTDTVTTTADQDVSVVLTNTGTGPAAGQYYIQLQASAVGNANAVGRLPLIVAHAETLNLPAGASVTLTLRVRLGPRLLRYASQFYLVANIDAAGINLVTDPLVEAISPQLLTLVPG